jgi:ABC-type enterobactin transport system permease subunit
MAMTGKMLDRVRSAFIAVATGTVLIISTAQAQTPSEFTLTSPDIVNGKKISDAQIFNSFGCSGKLRAVRA